MQKHSLKDRIPKIHSHQCPKIPQSPNLVKTAEASCTSYEHHRHHEVSLPYVLALCINIGAYCYIPYLIQGDDSCIT